MEHRIFSTYYQLSLEGLVEPWRCINNNHEVFMVPSWNVLTETTQIKCQVGDCDYTINPGLNFYNKISELVGLALVDKVLEDQND